MSCGSGGVPWRMSDRTVSPGTPASQTTPPSGQQPASRGSTKPERSASSAAASSRPTRSGGITRA